MVSVRYCRPAEPISRPEVLVTATSRTSQPILVLCTTNTNNLLRYLLENSCRLLRDVFVRVRDVEQRPLTVHKLVGQNRRHENGVSVCVEDLKHTADVSVSSLDITNSASGNCHVT